MLLLILAMGIVATTFANYNHEVVYAKVDEIAHNEFHKDLIYKCLEERVIQESPSDRDTLSYETLGISYGDYIPVYWLPDDTLLVYDFEKDILEQCVPYEWRIPLIWNESVIFTFGIRFVDSVNTYKWTHTTDSCAHDGIYNGIYNLQKQIKNYKNGTVYYLSLATHPVAMISHSGKYYVLEEDIRDGTSVAYIENTIDLKYALYDWIELAQRRRDYRNNDYRNK
jgi:hypothetical protein